jgi:hypothetical protein
MMNRLLGLYPDDQLTLFAVVDNVPDSLTYLVWANEGEEPQVWRYDGLESYRFKDLAEFLTWFGGSAAE